MTPAEKLVWQLVHRGYYVVRAPWGSVLELERRRQEGGEPAGWYLFGELPTGAWLEGRFMGAVRETAFAATVDWVSEVTGVAVGTR